MRDCPGTAAPRELAFFWQQKKARKENCRCFDAADPRLRGCTPLRTPKRRSEGAGAKRKQYYFSFLTPPPLPPPLSREFPRTPAVFNGCYNLGRQPAKRLPIRGAGRASRPEGSRRALRHRPSTGKGGGLPPSLAPPAHHPFTAGRRGRACPARSLASAPGFVLHPLYLLHRREGLRGCEQGPRLSGAKPGCEQCLPLRGKQPHERVCEANWRRSLCAAKR